MRGAGRCARVTPAVTPAGVDLITLPDGVTAGALIDTEAALRQHANVAEGLGADLIVMGTHGRAGLAHLLRGSVAERTLRRARCPVLAVRGDAPDRDPS